MEWTDLTAKQQCVLLNAVEESYLFDVLTECAPGRDWPEKLPRSRPPTRAARSSAPDHGGAGNSV